MHWSNNTCLGAASQCSAPNHLPPRGQAPHVPNVKEAVALEQPSSSRYSKGPRHTHTASSLTRACGKAPASCSKTRVKPATPRRSPDLLQMYLLNFHSLEEIHFAGRIQNVKGQISVPDHTHPPRARACGVHVVCMLGARVHVANGGGTEAG